MERTGVQLRWPAGPPPTRDFTPRVDTGRKGDRMRARVPAADSGKGHRVAEELRERGVRGVLVQMAERGQLIELRCEMPSCYCYRGRGYFETRTTPLPDWAPNPDHYPILKSAGGQLRADNVRLSHVLCNRRDYGWRMKIKAMLAKGWALEEIAEELNRKRVPAPHGRNTWSAVSVRRAFVS